MQEQTHVRTRFAPSPTGLLHIGNLRTAMYCWLFARHNKGTFILRIEDTDRERSTEEARQVIFEGLKWLGLDWDEGPFYQSARLELYKRKAEELVSAGRAYRSDLGDAEKGEAVVFRVYADDKVIINDLVHDPIKVMGETVKDFVIIKSDGYPSYNFACAVDDAEMQITHVIRGDDHISNTARQIMIYKAFGYELPHYAHLPMIMGMDGKRYSKRHGAAAVTDFDELGYLPDALFNFLSLLGWSPGNDREVMTRNEIIREFDIKRVRKTPARFDFEKLNWMNSKYIIDMGLASLKEQMTPFLEAAGMGDALEDGRIDEMIALYRERVKTLVGFVEAAKIFGFGGRELEFDDAAVDKFLKKPEAAGILNIVIGILEGPEDLVPEVMEAKMREVAKSEEISFKRFTQTVRVAVTGSDVSPPLFDVMQLLGRERCLSRLRFAKETF